LSRHPVRDYSRLEGTAFARSGVSNLTALVVGAGALGNEVLKALALIGVGRIVVVDRDRVERSNLTRSVLFCTPDIEQHLAAATPKAEHAARRVAEINPDVRAEALVGEIADVGLGVLRRADVVFGCLDNEMARMELGWACVRTDRLLVDGGLGNLNPSSGMVLVFPGKDGPCPLCRKSAARRRALLWELQGHEDPCWLKERTQEQAAVIPTTPVMASIVGSLQVELGLRLALERRASRGAEQRNASSLPSTVADGVPGSTDGKPEGAVGQAVRVQLHPGLALETRVFERSPSCPLHEPSTFLLDVETRTDRRSSSWRVGDLIAEAGADNLQLDWPITARAACRACGETWRPLVRRARFRRTPCPNCGGADLVELEVVSSISSESPLADRSLSELGLPSAHVHDLVGGPEGGAGHRYVEVTGDLGEEVPSC
jgi:molybdopterin/thiamine biosynthesis adenylyltransferase